MSSERREISAASLAGECRDADNWDRYWSSTGAAVSGNPATKWRARLIADHLGAIPAGELVLDVGCGQGELTLLLATSFPRAEIWGVDSSEEAVRRAAEAARARGLAAHFARLDLVTGEAAPLGGGEEVLWDRRASHVVCSEVLEHLDEPEIAVRRLAEHTAPGGCLVVTVPAGPRSAFDRYIGHRRHFTPSRLRRLLESNGFEAVRIDRAGFPFFNLYRLVVIARGRRLVADTEEPSFGSGLAGVVLHTFDRAFRYNLRSAPFGWQLVATAARSAGD